MGDAKKIGEVKIQYESEQLTRFHLALSVSPETPYQDWGLYKSLGVSLWQSHLILCVYNPIWDSKFYYIRRNNQINFYIHSYVF